MSDDSSDSSEGSDTEPGPQKVSPVLALVDMWDRIAGRLSHPQACALMCTCTQLLVQVSMSRVACCAPPAIPHGKGDRRPIHAHMETLETLGRAAYRGLASGSEACVVAHVTSQLAPSAGHMHKVAARVLCWCVDPPSLWSSRMSHVHCERKQSQATVRARACAWVRDSGVLRLAMERDRHVRELMERAVALAAQASAVV